MKLDGYIRVSRVAGRGGESYITEDQQRERITAFAKVMGADIARWHVDRDKSGGKLSRPTTPLTREAAEGRALR